MRRLTLEESERVVALLGQPGPDILLFVGALYRDGVTRSSLVQSLDGLLSQEELAALLNRLHRVAPGAPAPRVQLREIVVQRPSPGSCRSCGKPYAIRKADGLVRQHRIGGWDTPFCEGSLQPPAPFH